MTAGKRTRRPKRLRLVLVEWIDSHGGHGWKELDDIVPEALIIRSVGWLLHDTKDVKVVVPHIYFDPVDDDGTSRGQAPGQGRGQLQIPTAAVRRLRVLSDWL